MVDRCEALYVNEGKTYEEISSETGVSVPQLQRWGIKYEWRKKREDLKKTSLDANTQARGLVSETILEDLKKHKARYDKFFESLPEDQINVGASQQYTLVCKTIREILTKKEQKIDLQLFLCFLEDLVSYLKEHDPTALEALEKNFDEFVAFAKTKYAN